MSVVRNPGNRERAVGGGGGRCRMRSGDCQQHTADACVVDVNHPAAERGSEHGEVESDILVDEPATLRA